MDTAEQSLRREIEDYVGRDREVRLERQREIRDMETAEQREERLKIMRERQIERTAMETAEQSDLPAKVFSIRVFLYW